MKKLQLLFLLVNPCLILFAAVPPLAEMERRASKLISALVREDVTTILQLSDGELYYDYKHSSAEAFRIRREYGGSFRLREMREFLRLSDGETIFTARCDFSGRVVDLMLYVLPENGMFYKVVDLGITLPEPTREQLYSDFDYLVEMIKKFSPRIIPNRYLYQLDVAEKLAEYRGRIPQVYSLVEYASLVETALAACKGNHLWLVNYCTDFLQHPERGLRDIVDNGYLVIPDAIPVTFFVKNCLWRNSPSRPHIPLLYCQGNYYTRYEFSIGSRRYPHGMRLTAVNGRPVMDMLSRVQDCLTDYDWDRKFFFGNYEGYQDDFYRYLPEWQTQPFTFTFDNAGRIETVVLDPAMPESIQVDRPKITVGDIPSTVCYLHESQLLYIRIPEMERARLNFYLSRIREEVSRHAIKAAVIDIRNNPGGSDWVWTRLLALLQTGQENAPLCSAVNNNPDVMRFIARRQFSRTDTELSPEMVEEAMQEYRSRSFTFLGGESYLVKEEIYPPVSRECLFRKSLPVYLLVQNIYSSAGNLAALARRSDLITSVGFDNPRDIGQGQASILFSLPYSKLIIRTNVWTDFSQCRIPEDTVHVRVEVPVELTPEQLLEYYTAEVGDDLPYFLMTRDPFIKKVQELIQLQEKDETCFRSIGN